MFIKTYEHLLATDRLDDLRRQLIAQELWNNIHSAFFLEPKYWCLIAIKAQEINQITRPVQAIYNYPFLCYLNPLTIQLIMLPKRWIFYKTRDFFKKL